MKFQQGQQLQMCQLSRSQKLYYASSSWLGDRRIVKNSRYTSFRFFVYKNYNAEAAAVGVLAADMSHRLQVLIFVFPLVKIVTP